MERWEAIQIQIRHDDPAMEAVFEKLRTFCKWTVTFSDTEHICQCLKHDIKLKVPNMVKTRVDPNLIRSMLSEYYCVGDWGD